MTPASPNHLVHRAAASALLIFPCAFLLVLAMHFRHFADFLKFKMHYEPASPERVAAVLIAGHNRAPLLHDPHMIAYLALPALPLCALALYLLGRGVRPIASAITWMVTMAGTIYMGGLFGMWTAFYRGLGGVDQKNLAGAAATFAAMTAPHGAFLLTTSLAKLTMIGLAGQALILLGTRVVPAWSSACVAVGSAIVLTFWDLDNWMIIGIALILAGFLRMRQALRGEHVTLRVGDPSNLQGT